MGECKTICKRCRFHEFRTDSRKIDVWYMHYCKSKEVEREKEQDPVTGKIQYAQKNDLGRVVLTDERYPHCRDINHGNCPHYEPKGVLRTVFGRE